MLGIPGYAIQRENPQTSPSPEPDGDPCRNFRRTRNEINANRLTNFHLSVLAAPSGSLQIGAGKKTLLVVYRSILKHYRIYVWSEFPIPPARPRRIGITTYVPMNDWQVLVNYRGISELSLSARWGFGRVEEPRETSGFCPAVDAARQRMRIASTRL
jgi:hypothetical protein